MKNFLPFLVLVISLLFNHKISAQVVINEFSGANFGSIYDNYGEDSDWIELYNTGAASVDLSGYYLSDKIDNPTKFQVPAGVNIGAGAHLVIWASERDEFNGGFLHTNFKITQTKSSEAIVLAGPSGTIIDFHEIDVPNQVNHSWARMTDGDSNWGVSLNPDPGAQNIDVSDPYSPKPVIAPSAGYYAGSVTISISDDDPDVNIYYTTDGTVPDNNSILYSGSFTLNSSAVVKAIAINNDPHVPASFVDFHSYIINDVHSIPVVSITGDEVFDLLNGNYGAEPIGTFELFNESGDRVADATGEFNKHGNDSWAYDQRGIDYITRDQFGDDYAVKHDIFNPQITDRDEFQRIILKAAANDNYPFENGSAHIRDAYVHTLSQLANLEMDERTYEPCVLYVNGEYWGVYEIREKVDDHDFTKYYYDQGRSWIDFLKTWGGTWQEYGSWDDWYPLADFVVNNDMTDAGNYAYVEERLEVLSLIDYVILHSHNVSSDWLNWNTGWWRGRKPSGGAKKWRYILWDEDATFGHYINYTGVPDQSPFADPCNPEVLGDPGGQGHVPIFNALLNNQDFLSLYINRYADLNNTYFTCDFMIDLLDDMIGRIEPEMPKHIDRWGGTMNEWQNNVQELRDFILTRCTVISDGIVDCYEDLGITGPYNITINVEPVGSGDVQANTISGLNYPWNAQYFGGIDFDLTGVPADGFVFSYWEVANHSFSPDQFSEAISMGLNTDDIITAHFQPAIPCGSPYSFETDSTLTTINLNWSGPVNTISYEVRYRKLGDLDWNINSTVDPDILIDDLESCTDYEFEVRTICQQDLSSYEIILAQTACPVSTYAPNELFGSVSVFPNPFREEVNVELEILEAGDITIDILSITGQLIQNQSFLNNPSGIKVFNINTQQQLPEGIYLVSIQTKKGKVVRKLIKG
jgi:CotH protein/lamin tail-like protein/chitobiase/beta-hexosaminidase-like protein/type IX secretion system substrate protein/fibronectin type III domain protein